MDSVFEKIVVDNQILICPTTAQWHEIFESQEVNGQVVPIIELVKKIVLRNSKYRELKTCLVLLNGKWMPIEILEINNELVRVFVESVFCFNCGERAVISATPGVADIYFGLDAEGKATAMKRGFRHKNLCCKFCNRVYSRRYTIWQKYE